MLIGAALTDNTNEVCLNGETKSHKKKRKKRSRQAEVQETDDSKVTLSDTEEQMKQLKVSGDETESLKTGSSKRKKMRGVDRGSSLKDSVADSADGEQVDKMDVSTPSPLKKKKRQKRKHLGDHPDIETARDDHPEQATQFCDAKIVDVDESVQGDQGSGVVPRSLGEHASQEDNTMDTHTIEEGDVALPLTPLGHTEKMTREKKTVQRQLPQWITEADVIPDNISEESR